MITIFGCLEWFGLMWGQATRERGNWSHVFKWESPSRKDAGLVNFVFVKALNKPPLMADTKQRCFLGVITDWLVKNRAWLHLQWIAEDMRSFH